jgi:restriction system protein
MNNGKALLFSLPALITLFIIYLVGQYWVNLALGNYDVHSVGFGLAVFFTTLILFGIVAGVVKAILVHKKREQNMLNMSDFGISIMTGEQFENYCAWLLRKNGYTNVRGTNRVGDYGADLLATTPYGEKIVVQCKRYNANVGNSAIQQAYSAKPLYGCTKAAVMTNSFFTEAAKIQARGTGVLLWDKRTLDEMKAS